MLHLFGKSPQFPAVGEFAIEPLFLQSRVCLPAERCQPAHIQELARGAVWARGVEPDLALESDHAGNDARQFRDRDVAADADMIVLASEYCRSR